MLNPRHAKAFVMGTIVASVAATACGGSSRLVASGATTTTTATSAEVADQVAAGEHDSAFAIDFDNPTKNVDGARTVAVSDLTGLSPIAPATGALVAPIVGKYVTLEPAVFSVVSFEGEKYPHTEIVHFKESRAYIQLTTGGYYSNEMAKAFVEQNLAGSKARGTELAVVDLGDGFVGFSSTGRGSAAVQFGTCQVVVAGNLLGCLD
jgi:hypothetical protein